MSMPKALDSWRIMNRGFSLTSSLRISHHGGAREGIFKLEIDNWASFLVKAAYALRSEPMISAGVFWVTGLTFGYW